MLDNTILVKTAAGRVEIDDRKLKIGARQRMVLISINGERTIESIRKQTEVLNGRPQVDGVTHMGPGL